MIIKNLSMLKTHKYTLLWVIWTIAVISLSLISSNEIPKPSRIPYADKIAHFGFYFGYTSLFVLSFGKETQWVQSIKKYTYGRLLLPLY